MSTATGPEPLRVVNPATGQTLLEIPAHTNDEVEQRVNGAHEAFQAWRRTTFAQRATLLRNVARRLRERKQSLAIMMAHEMGKPVREGEAEVEKCALVCEYYADNAESFLRREEVKTEARRSYVAFRPLGVVLAIMPWNFPLWQVFRFAAPALMAGNTVLLKHASNVPGCANSIEGILSMAGAPTSIFTTLLIDAPRAQVLIADPRIVAVTVTGSTEAGRSIASVAGQHLKKTVLELGGSDPYVVLADADLDATVDACAAARMINAGQSCIAAKRFIVVDSVREEFTRRLAAKLSSLRMGNPLDRSTDYGPLARHDLRDQLHSQVERSIAKGAKLLLGGTIPSGSGAFYPATLLADVRPGMPAYHEELFGPVAAIIAAKDTADAIRIANDTAYGLGGAVFTRDVQEGERLATDELQAGFVAVNAQVKSDPRLPFGGVKDSGYGRELSTFGIREFVNVKTVDVG